MAQQGRVGRVHTTIHTDENGITHVIYHSTAVVSFNAERIWLRTGGWQSATTKTRMNQASAQYGLGYHVSQKAGRWLVAYGDKVMEFGAREISFARETVAA